MVDVLFLGLLGIRIMQMILCTVLYVSYNYRRVESDFYVGNLYIGEIIQFMIKQC